jgi:hypothetical protein
MSKKHFLDNIDDEALAELTDAMLKIEKQHKHEGRANMMRILKIIPAVAAIVLVIGLANYIGLLNIDDMFNPNAVITVTDETTEDMEITTDINEVIIESDTTEEILDIPDEIPEYIVINGESYSTSATELALTFTSLTNADIEPLKYMVN